jgi:predicted O-methyltransferase YrrM
MYKEYVQTLLGERPDVAVEKATKKEEIAKSAAKSYQKNKIVQKIEIKIEKNDIQNRSTDISNSNEQYDDNKNDTQNQENESFCMLNDGALILVDNVLWKGTVLGQVNYFASNLIIIIKKNCFMYNLICIVCRVIWMNSLQ